MALVASRIPHPSAEHLENAIAAAQEHLWRFGLTGVHDFDGARCFGALQALRAEGRLGLRVVKHIRSDEAPAAFAAGIRSGLGDGWIRIGNLKLFADGALGPRTLRSELADGEPYNRGRRKTVEELVDSALDAASAGHSRHRRRPTALPYPPWNPISMNCLRISIDRAYATAPLDDIRRARRHRRLMVYPCDLGHVMPTLGRVAKVS
jgi:hypothetical protein